MRDECRETWAPERTSRSVDVHHLMAGLCESASYREKKRAKKAFLINNASSKQNNEFAKRSNGIKALAESLV